MEIYTIQYNTIQYNTQAVSSYHNCERGPCDDGEIAHCRMFCHNRYRNSRRSTGCQHRTACHASVADVEPDDPCGRMPCHSFHTDIEKSSRRSLELVDASTSDSHHNGQPTTKYNRLYCLQDARAPNIHLGNGLRKRHTYYLLLDTNRKSSVIHWHRECKVLRVHTTPLWSTFFEKLLIYVKFTNFRSYIYKSWHIFFCFWWHCSQCIRKHSKYGRLCPFAPWKFIDFM